MRHLKSSYSKEKNLMRRTLTELARNPDLISGIYNYCDRWCERCPLSNRCLTYAMEVENDDGDPAARDIENEKFWGKLQETFSTTLEMIKEKAQELGIDVSQPDSDGTVEATERRLDRMSREHPVAHESNVYLKAVDPWMKRAGPLFEAKGVELETKARLEIADPLSEAREVKDCVDII